jgi:hypothetical protein
MTTYRIVDMPTFVEAGDETPMPGYYRAAFTTERGDRVVRFLTDKGRAEILRTVDRGRRAFQPDEVEAWSVEPNLSALERRAADEGGEGA